MPLRTASILISISSISVKVSYPLPVVSVGVTNDARVDIFKLVRVDGFLRALSTTECLLYSALSLVITGASLSLISVTTSVIYVLEDIV